MNIHTSLHHNINAKLCINLPSPYILHVFQNEKMNK